MSTFPGIFAEFGPCLRADRFSGEPATYNLLTHTHSDHMQGLRRVNGFRGHLLCTPITLSWLTKLEGAQERAKLDAGLLEKADRPYAIIRKSARLQLVECLDHAVLPLPAGQGFIKVTPIDANHCPGSCMFLLEHFALASCEESSFVRSVLYTGDIRADPDWVAKLARLECLHPYVVGSKAEPMRRLDKIYLDTSAMLDNSALLSNTEATERTLRLMEQMPPQTRFYINAWTSGYEHFLIAISRHFDTPIHLDRWKYLLYKSFLPSDEFSECFIIDPTRTRFHACQKQFKCDQVWNNGRGCYQFSAQEQQQIYRQCNQPSSACFGKQKLNVGCGCSFTAHDCMGEACTKEAEDEELVVYVNPAEPFERGRYEKYARSLDLTIKECTHEALRRSTAKQPAAEPVQWPDHLLVPFSRHSTLPELRRFVDLFQPHSLYPNTIMDPVRQTDYFLSAFLFEKQLAAGGKQRVLDEAAQYLSLFNTLRGASVPPPSDDALARVSARLCQDDVIHEVSEVALINLAGPSKTEEEARQALGLADTWTPNFSTEDIEVLAEDDPQSYGEDEETTARLPWDDSPRPVGGTSPPPRASKLLELSEEVGEHPVSEGAGGLALQSPLPIDGDAPTVQQGRFSQISQVALPRLEEPASQLDKSLLNSMERSSPRFAVSLDKDRRALVRKTQEHKRRLQSDPQLQSKTEEARKAWKRLKSEVRQAKESEGKDQTTSEQFSLGASSFRTVKSP